MRYRDILLWNTNNNVCNAGVMGLISPVRYILLSDALLQTMTDQQIEAVFAHEMGHVVHRHMVWYVIFFILCIVGIGGLEDAVLVNRYTLQMQEVFAIGGLAALFWAFGFISRQCERQADVYAARLMELTHRQTNGDTSELIFSAADLVAPLSPAVAGAALKFAVPYEPGVHLNPTVGRHGAAIFSSALHRVAVVNNISLKRFEIFHGSIFKRMQFLRDLAAHPKRSDEFDRQMQRMYALLLLGLFVSLLWIAVTTLTQH
jgi:STE24 endopeptidase